MIMMQREHQAEETSEDDGVGVGRGYGAAMVPLGKDFEPGDDDVIVGR